MGACESQQKKTAKQNDVHTKKLDALLATYHAEPVYKLLLLGAAESGRLELFKQILTLFGTEKSNQEFQSRRIKKEKELLGLMLELLIDFPSPVVSIIVNYMEIQCSAVLEEDLLMDEWKFRLIDAGGQCNAIRKWIHFFDDFPAVVFVVAISEYDEVLDYDKINRLSEALDVFDGLCGSYWLPGVEMILILNKTDLFREKLHSSPLNQTFSDYLGNTFDDACKYIKSEFLKRNYYKKPVHSFFLPNETDTEKVEALMSAIKLITIRAELAKYGHG